MALKIYTTADHIPDASPELLGGKGFGLVEMAREGIPVPPAVIIPPEVCREYRVHPEEVMAWVVSKVIPLTKEFLKGSSPHVPLVSVRSGAQISMPGMMDTILNVGMDADNRYYWDSELGEDCYEDCYERLVTMYSDVVLGMKYSDYAAGKSSPDQVFWAMTGGVFPDRDAQYREAIEAVFKSWDNPRAVSYRQLHNIPDDLGTAVILQTMVFGNRGKDSCTGVVFSRNPSTGESGLYGEWLENAQGEDIVAGTRTPVPITEMESWNWDVYLALRSSVMLLEQLRADMQDIEFTVEKGKLWILQTRNGKRSAEAALSIAMDMYKEKLIDKATIAKRVTLRQYFAATGSKLSQSGLPEPSGIGIPASTGVAVGRAVFSSASALKCTGPCILIANETTPDDIEGIAAAEGILTSTGGATSHAAVVARGMDKVCVVGAIGMELSENTASCGGKKVKEGDWVTLDGATGRFWLGHEAKVLDGSSLPAAKEFRNLLRNTDSSYNIALTSQEARVKGTFVPAVLVGDKPLKKMVAKMKEGFIDLRTSAEVIGSPEKALEEMFGLGAEESAFEQIRRFPFGQVKPEAKLMVLLSKHASKAAESWFKNKLIDFSLSGSVRLVPTVSTLEELIMHPGWVVSEMLSWKQDVVRQLCKLKRAAGEDTGLVVLGGSGSVAKTDLQRVQEFLT